MQNVGKLSRENKYGTGFIRLTIRKSPSGYSRARESPAVATVRPAVKKKRKKEKKNVLTVLSRSAFFIPFE